MLKDDEIDVISICLPSHVQAEAAIRAAEAGKHILIEKPIAKTFEELVRLRDVIRKTGVTAIAGFVLRWNPMITITKGLIDEGWIGKVIYVRVAYFHELNDWLTGWHWVHKKETGGSVMILGGCHAMDMARYLMGSDAEAVTAYSARGTRSDFEYEPTVAGMVKFKNGAVAHVAASQEFHMPYIFPVEVMGSEGAIRDNKVWSKKMEGQTDWMEIPTILPDSGKVDYHPFQPEIDHLVECILTGKKSHLSIEDGYKTHELVFAYDISAENGGQQVKIPLQSE
jgi:predicted dehydrogenase